jgi:hypothetical protein
VIIFRLASVLASVTARIILGSDTTASSSSNLQPDPKMAATPMDEPEPG